ncbi:MAG TPA: hypothetical protein V6D22_16595, partial [Candidatus Obscuribacterales bacterium]
SISWTKPLAATTIDLLSSNGSIGTTKALSLSATNLTVDAPATKGVVNVSDTLKTGVTMQGTSGAGKSFSLTSAGSILQGSPSAVINTPLLTISSKGAVTIDTAGSLTIKKLTANGDTTITAGTAAANSFLNTAAKSVISVTNGKLTLENADDTTGSINIGNKSQIKTGGPSGHDVTITIGAPVITAGSAPTNVKIGKITPPGIINFGTAGMLVGTAPTNTVNAIKATLTFSAPAGLHINLGGSTKITADPSTPVVGAPQSLTPGSNTSTAIEAVQTTSVAQPNAVQVAPVTISPNAMSNSSVYSAMLNAARSAAQPDAAWASYTELANGKIPATVSSDAKLGIKSSVSTVLEMNEENGAATAAGTAAKVTTLNRGSVVFAPTSNILVRTPYGDVNVAANSVVVVMVYPGGVSTFDVDDTHADAVTVKSGNDKLSLRPGLSITITGSGVKSFGDVNPAQLVMYRDIEQVNVGAGTKAFVAEFAPWSVIHAVMPLSQMVNSKQADARRIADHMLKTTAIVLQTRANKGSKYQQVMRPSVAAWNQ